MSLFNDLVFTEALEYVEKILGCDNPDQIADMLELIAPNKNLSLACMMLLVLKVKGTDVSKLNGVELANTRPTFANLILPPGVKR